MSFFWSIFIIVITLIFTAVFVAYEMALASVSRARLAVLVGRKRKGAEEAAFMKDRMEASLAVVQVSVTLMSAVAAATGGAGAAESLAPYLRQQFAFSEIWAKILALVFLIIPLSTVTIIFGELIPKMFALRNREWICLRLSPGMKTLSQIAYPVITVMERIVKWAVDLGHRSKRFKRIAEDDPGLHELTAAASLARAARLIGTREEKIVLSAAQLSIRPVKDIMLKASDISMIPLQATLTDALIKAHLDMHTRFPVCDQENDPQTISGYVNFKDIVATLRLNPADPSIKGILRPIKTIPSDLPISQSLEKMMQEKLHIALIVDKEQKVVGLVSLEDIIEELVGEIEDEYDRLPTHIHPFGGGWIVGGGVPFNVVAQTAGISWSPQNPNDSIPRLADWFSQKVGGGPLSGGEVIESDGLQVMVRKLRRRKLSEAIVNLVAK